MGLILLVIIASACIALAVVLVGIMITIIPYIIGLGLFLLAILWVGSWIQNLQLNRKYRGPR